MQLLPTVEQVIRRREHPNVNELSTPSNHMSFWPVLASPVVPGRTTLVLRSPSMRWILMATVVALWLHKKVVYKQQLCVLISSFYGSQHAEIVRNALLSLAFAWLGYLSAVQLTKLPKHKQWQFNQNIDEDETRQFKKKKKNTNHTNIRQDKCDRWITQGRQSDHIWQQVSNSRLN